MLRCPQLSIYYAAGIGGALLSCPRVSLRTRGRSGVLLRVEAGDGGACPGDSGQFVSNGGNWALASSEGEECGELVPLTVMAACWAVKVELCCFSWCRRRWSLPQVLCLGNRVLGPRRPR